MSSHHIVRDNQEPALLFIDIKCCNTKILEQLLEWSPFIIATKETDLFLESWDVQPDIILEADSKTKLINEAFDILLKQNQKMVNIVCDITIISQFENRQSEVTILNKDWKWSFIRSGKLKKWVPKNSQLSLKSEIVKINNHNGHLTLNELENIPKDGMICFESEKAFWLGEKIV